jgi:hypothetical protein
VSPRGNNVPTETIIRDLRHHTAVVDPPIPAVAAALTYSRREFGAGGACGLMETVVTKSSYMFDYRGRIGLPAGLIPRVTMVLRNTGYAVVMQTIGTSPPLVIDHERRMALSAQT